MNNKFIVTIEGQRKIVEINGNGQIYVDSEYLEFESEILNGQLFIKTNSRIDSFDYKILNRNSLEIMFQNRIYEIDVKTELEEKTSILLSEKNKNNSKIEVRAPMPGLILKLSKKEGEEVKIGDSLLILEAMKMENDLTAKRDGIIKNLNVIEGQTIEKNQLLMKIE
ncbi:MAG: hypothetical protein K9J12_06635 [Melioribacteraceae bacterium]|nr:hypothetical protein [Melioribacteraceae bacterium]MCF8264571.1 hypothetical protein [Melioribacteraceae bacterium]MCF8412334.1 hypothetical protein [Melioribacteraceae bacterium]